MTPDDTGNPSLVVERMAALLAHDLCNSMSAIKINLQLLERSAGRLPQDAERCRISLTQIAGIEALIADLQAFSRPERLHLSRFSARQLLEGAQQRHAALAKEAGIAVLLDIPDTLPMLYGDQARLELAVGHLLRNALEASDAGQSVRFAAQRLPEAGMIEITLSDTGGGMDAGILAQACRPFFSTRLKGRGLGLAIAERTALAHGGHLMLESSPGQGCCARLCLPLAGG